MKIAIYHPWIYLKSGLERTIVEIARRSRHDIRIYTSHYDRKGTYPELADYGVREVNRVPVERNYGSVLQAGRTIALTKLALADADALVICCDGLGTFLTLRNHAVPVINLCFTPLRAIYDAEYRSRHLEKHADKRLFSRLLELAYRVADRLMWRRFRHVVCISETVKERVLTAGLAVPNRMSVNYPGIDAESIETCEGHQNYFFLPGRIMWTKNIALGLQAYLRFRERGGPPFRLVVAGMVDAKSRAYFEELKVLAAGSPDIDFIIEPDDAQMQDLYRNCFATLFTAFNEDLGLTPMEAMAKGKPVIAVNKGGPREVIDPDVTGYLVENDPEVFATAMLQLTADPAAAEAMGRAGQQRVTRFTWQSFVRDFDDLLEQTLTGNPR